MPDTAVVLASGGLDSTTCMAVAADAGLRIVALSFDYGQRHAIEIEAAARVAKHFGAARHIVSAVGLLRELGGSALTADIDVPRDRDEAAMADDIPVTYVPGRNLIFLSHATAVAEVVGARAVYIGVNAVDYSGYPDCRPEFIDAFTRAARLATKVGIEGADLEIRMPLVELSKADIIRLGQRLGAPYHLTHSCYDPAPDDAACGRCDSCRLRLKGFAEAGLDDPIRYAG